ncbi:hypothetical protein Hanom_Chr12g01112441 [Helianthus anomalus]
MLDPLRLKSFDSKEFDIRATRTPKGGSAGQGGSGFALITQVSNVVPAQTAVVTGSDKGKGVTSSGTKGSGSKFIIEDEGVRVSVEDKGVHAEGDEEGE